MSISHVEGQVSSREAPSHLFYNTIVFIPMVVAMVYHLWPSAPEAAAMRCSCAWPSHAVHPVQ